ncbi:regulatory protein RecX [Thalassotalea agarivorans]|uniref:Regulatory protein RecX n=1 Tax=Thalassotalea agarivorans TaxID=349064 RepID=A0A1H9Z8X5_THASX|nr:regulatory protein RecX [Thalassotalea agarivorans]SES77997.1 regulatory protein [Thalassotalea agarivorans]
MNKSVLHRAIALLARREHGEKELSRKLQQKGFEADDIREVMTFLLDNDYQSDIRYADSVFRSRISKGYGWLYIKQELAQKGIATAIVSGLNTEQIDWYDQAQLAYNKRFGDSPVLDQKDKAKRVRFLQGRGFDFDQIMAVIK